MRNLTLVFRCCKRYIDYFVHLSYKRSNFPGMLVRPNIRSFTKTFSHHKTFAWMTCYPAKNKPMRKNLLFLSLLWMTGFLAAQTTHVVQQSGFSYSPETVNIKVGDSVRFEGEANHPIAQVSENTWTNNGTTLLAGGFTFASGSGTVGFPQEGTYYYVCTSHVASNQMKGRIVVSTATGVDDLAADKMIVYPVPLTADVLTIKLKSGDIQALSVEVFDVTGKMILSSEGIVNNGIYRINCATLDKGMFLMRVNTGNEAYITKFTK